VTAPETWQPIYTLYSVLPALPRLEALDSSMPEPLWDHRFQELPGTASSCSIGLFDPEGHPVVRVDQARGDEGLPAPEGAEGWAPETAELLGQTKGIFVVSIRPGAAPPVQAVQAALGAAMALFGHQAGLLHDLSAGRLIPRDTLHQILSSDDFAVEDHVSLHLVLDAAGSKAWLHSHGMEKFGRSDLEIFDLDTARGRDAGRLMNQLLLSSALETRTLVDELIEIPGGTLRAIPSDALRPGVTSIPPEEFLHHEGPYLCLVDASTCGDISKLVDGYMHRALGDLTNPEDERELTRHILPLVRRHFRKNGSSDAFEYFARIPLLVRRGERTARESIWVKITRWRGSALRGVLASDSMFDAEMPMGAEVAFEPEDIEAILLSANGEALAGRRLEKLLR
jgi:hypothetical protein